MVSRLLRRHLHRDGRTRAHAQAHAGGDRLRSAGPRPARRAPASSTCPAGSGGTRPSWPGAATPRWAWISPRSCSPRRGAGIARETSSASSRRTCGVSLYRAEFDAVVCLFTSFGYFTERENVADAAPHGARAQAGRTAAPGPPQSHLRPRAAHAFVAAAPGRASTCCGRSRSTRAPMSTRPPGSSCGGDRAACCGRRSASACGRCPSGGATFARPACASCAPTATSGGGRSAGSRRASCCSPSGRSAEHVVQRPGEVERLLRHVVALAVEDGPAPAQRLVTAVRGARAAWYRARPRRRAGRRSAEACAPAARRARARAPARRRARRRPGRAPGARAARGPCARGSPRPSPAAASAR